MTISIKAVSLAGLMLLATAAGIQGQAAASLTSGSAEPEVRVINNHHYPIRVVLIDRAGRERSLGRVSQKKAAVFALDYGQLGASPVQVKIFPDEPVWSAGNTGKAIRSQNLHLYRGMAVYVWAEPDLASSEISVGY